MTVLVTGGAGYIGSHMVHALLDAGERVVVLDNLSTGRHANVKHLEGQKDFTLIIDSVMHEPLAPELGVEPVGIDVNAPVYLSGASLRSRFNAFRAHAGR